MADPLQQLAQVYVDAGAIIKALRSGDPHIYRLVAGPARRAHQALGELIKRYARHGTTGVALPAIEPSQNVALAAAATDPDRVLPSGPARQKIMVRQRRVRRELLL